MDIGQLTPALVLTVAGASVVTTILVGVIMRAWKPDPAMRDRFGPVVALLVGVVVVLVFGFLQSATDYASLLLTGILAGSGSMGIYDTVRGFTK